jgi:hypothetical protein
MPAPGPVAYQVQPGRAQVIDQPLMEARRPPHVQVAQVRQAQAFERFGQVLEPQQMLVENARVGHGLRLRTRWGGGSV